MHNMFTNYRDAGADPGILKGGGGGVIFFKKRGGGGVNHLVLGSNLYCK